MAVPKVESTGAATRVAAARDLVAHDHARMIRQLDELFRAGSPPRDALRGPYAGTLVTTTFGTGADALTDRLGHLYMPWRGKVFDPAGMGGNLFSRRSKRLIRPFYPAVRDGHAGLVYAYPFRTYTAPGVVDQDRTVLKIDYDLPANRFGLIRRVLDELVEVDAGYFLGKAHLRVRGRWHTVAYFALQPWAQ
jgi:hypothetical protein